MEEDKDLKIKLLEEEIEQLKLQLSKYTNPQRYKEYYEKNKDIINEKKRIYAKEYYKKIKNLKE
jgi:hypothetical protein